MGVNGKEMITIKNSFYCSFSQQFLIYNLLFNNKKVQAEKNQEKILPTTIFLI